MTQFGPRVEIYEKPTYVGGSGPPMAPITLLPEHDDKSWVIAQLIDYPNVPHYVVHPKGTSVVRKVVQKDEILDWVSPRVLEAFEFEEGVKRDDQEEENEKRRERRKLTKNGKKRGRPFKNLHTGAWAPVAESIETETDTAEITTDPDHLARSLQLQQPSISQPSLSQPTLSLQNFSLKRKMESLFDYQDADSTEEESARSVGMDLPASKRSRTDIREGLTRKAPMNLEESFSNNQTVQNPAPMSPRHKRSKSMAELSTAPHHDLSNTKIRTPQRSTAPPLSVSNSNQHSLRDRSSRPFYGIRPTRASRSISAAHTASPTKTRFFTTPARYLTRSSLSTSSASPSRNQQRPASQQGKSVGSKRATSAPQKRSKTSPLSRSKPAPISTRSMNYDDGNDNEEDEENNDKQWTVIKLLDDKWNMIKKRRCHYYLVEWEGDYEPTWERARDIAVDLKESYETKKRQRAAISRSGMPAKEEKTLRTANDMAASNSSDDPLADAPRQVTNGSSGLFVSSDDADDGDNMADRLFADIPMTAKREEFEERLSEWPLSQQDYRSPYFRQHLPADDTRSEED